MLEAILAATAALSSPASILSIIVNGPTFTFTYPSRLMLSGIERL